MSAVQSLKAGEFVRQVLNFDRSVVVDFFATRCPPFRMLAPVLESLAQQGAGQIDFDKVDADRDYSLAERYQISSVHTLVMFCAGAGQDQPVAGLGPNALREQLERLLRHWGRQKALQPI